MTAPAALPDVDAMEAGPEMDALIEREIFGREPTEKHGEIEETSAGDPRCIICGEKGTWSDDPFSGLCVPPYSTDDAAALEVLKKIPKPAYADAKLVARFDPDGKSASSRFPIWEVGWQEPDEDGPDFIDFLTAGADTLALAICRAALKSIR